MDINEKLAALMEHVTRKDVSEIFATEINRAKRYNQRMTTTEERRRNPEIIADCLLAVYRAGAWDGLNAANDNGGQNGET